MYSAARRGLRLLSRTGGPPRLRRLLHRLQMLLPRLMAVMVLSLRPIYYMKERT